MAWFIVQSLITLVLAFALGIVVGWLVWARRRPADTGVSAEPVAAKRPLGATEEQLAACTCDTEAEPAADIDLDADVDVDLDPLSEEVDVDPDVISAAQDVDVAELVATYEALEEIDTDLDSPTVSADGAAVETESDTDDVAALAVAVGALSATADDVADVERDPDDIERIEGIGPKIGKALRAAGLDTYSAIADASPEALREAVKAGGVKFAPSVESWPGQARLLADGDEAGFQALTGRLVADRVKG